MKLTRVEVTEVDVDDKTKEAMQIQLNAERVRRGTVTEAEGIKQATQLQADAKLYSAQKEAEAEEIRFQKALEKAKADVEKAKGAELDKLNEKIKQLEDLWTVKVQELKIG